VATSVGGDEVPGMIDEFPILAVLAARAEGVTRITGAGELRLKESDRIRALAENLRAVGVRAEELGDGLEIEGGDQPLAGRVSSHGDHRIAMAFGVLGALEGNQIEIDGADVADVSFPDFWGLLEDLTTAGP
jgi:3-phosphoshikimate 1-carboxyvinyltransferase